MDVARINELLVTYRDGLLNDTLPFWLEHCVDRDCGGFIMSLGRDGTVIDTDKAVWQQCRFTWLLGELYNNVERRDDWLELARHGIHFIDDHCTDPKDGRMWFHVTRDGRPIRKRRYAYSESFAAIAWGELAQATGSDEYAEKARRTFQRFLSHNLDPQNVEPKFTDTRPLRSLGFPMITIATAQELRDSIGLPDADKWIERSISDICRYHLKDDIQCLMETVGRNGELHDHFDGRTLNPGHAIECAWFILQEGSRKNDSGLIGTGCRMLDWMWERGWDKEQGGIFSFVDVRGLPMSEPLHDMKYWWPHNETIIATLLAWQLTGETRYANMHAQVHDWSYARFPDPEHGEWFGYLHRDGSLSTPIKGSLWKGPFHLPRMQLRCWKLLEETTPTRLNPQR